MPMVIPDLSFGSLLRQVVSSYYLVMKDTIFGMILRSLDFPREVQPWSHHADVMTYIYVIRSATDIGHNVYIPHVVRKRFKLYWI